MALNVRFHANSSRPFVHVNRLRHLRANIGAPRRKGDVLTRLTTILAGIFFLTSLTLAIMAEHRAPAKSILDVPTDTAAPAAKQAAPAAPAADKTAPPPDASTLKTIAPTENQKKKPVAPISK